MMNNETQADIAVEIRTYFQTQKRNGNPEHRPWHQVLSDWADRIEATAEREREMAKGLSKKLDENRAITGNGAAIHTALDSVRIEMLKRLAGIQPQISDMGILELCVDAQHKPVRNCDRFQTASEVSAYWGANVHAVPLHGDAYGMHIDGETYPTFLDWLFAKAEGGEK